LRATFFLGLLAASIAAAALVSASGAATTRAEKVATLDVSTPTAVMQYLRSIHVDPTGVVVQRGTQNYAGSNCPGKGWSCTTTTHPVVQVASAGGRNTFTCTTARCAVVQVAAAPAAAPNTAKCIRTTGLGQSCSISQSSSTRDNLAIVYENAVKASGLTQSATSTASITQQATGASNSNTACVTQNISITGSTAAKKGTPVNVNLEAHQTVNITQDALGSGGNSAQSAATSAGACGAGTLGQMQTLNSTANGSGSITQNENAANGGANMTIDIEQNQGSGNGVGSGPNTANFVQTNSLNAIANSPAGPVSQTQSFANGGLLGTINQDSSGVSTATTTQTETQCEDASTSGLTSCDTSDGDAGQAPSSLTQVQFGPLHKGVGEATQTGNSSDSFTVAQTSTQDTDQGPGSHQTNVVQGDCRTDGDCTVSQTTNVDGQLQTNTQSGSDLSTTTNCTGSECSSSTGTITFDGSPGTGAPPSTLGPYAVTAFGPDPQPVCNFDPSTQTFTPAMTSVVSDPAGTITFDEQLNHDRIGIHPNCWATWSNGYPGDVYDTTQSTDVNQVTVTLPSGTDAFYFYAEPNLQTTFTMTATAQDGTTSGPITVDGTGGARYFGFYGTRGATIASITVTADPNAQGFAVGEFGIHEVVG
jgi:hypothetical protein